MTVHLYVVDGVVVDTALRHMQPEVVDCLRRQPVHTVVLTHHHEDHSGNAARLGSAFSLPLLGHPLTVEKMRKKFKIFPYQHLAWGAAQPAAMEALPEVVGADHIELHPVHTPGHSRDHTVFLEKNRGWLFSGDLFIAERIKYFRADEKMKDQIDSLEKVCRLEFDSLFCAHNPQPENGKAKLEGKLQHLRDFLGAVERLRTRGLGADEAAREMGLKENRLLKAVCMGNLSMQNMVRAAYQSLDATDRQ